MITTTVNQIKRWDPDQEMLDLILASMGDTSDYDAPFQLSDIVTSSGADVALWALRCVSGGGAVAAEFAQGCAVAAAEAAARARAWAAAAPLHSDGAVAAAEAAAQAADDALSAATDCENAEASDAAAWAFAASSRAVLNAAYAAEIASPYDDEASRHSAISDYVAAASARLAQSCRDASRTR